MRVALYCICGDGASGELPEADAPRFEEIFWRIHNGEGHGTTDAATAQAARRERDRQDINAARRDRR